MLAATDAGATIRIRTLGGLRVTTASGEAGGPWLDGDAGLVLRFLVAYRGRPVPATRIVRILWPELDGTPDGVAVLRAALDVLRDALVGDGVRGLVAEPVVGYRGGLELHPYLVWCDVDDFERAAGTGLAALAEGEPGAAMTWLRSARAMYRGDFLADMDPAEHPWLAAPALHLRDLAERVGRQLMTADRPVPVIPGRGVRRARRALGFAGSR